jgi:hypothetical protein
MNMKKLILIAGLLYFSNGFSSTPPDIDSFRSTIEKFESEQFIKFNTEPVQRPDPDMNKLYVSVNGDSVFEYLSELTNFSVQSKEDGNALWGRIAGSIYEKGATEYVASKFKEWGMEHVRIQEFNLTSGDWYLEKAALQVQLGNSTDAWVNLGTATTPYPSGVTSDLGILAPLQYVGLGTIADLRGRDLSGKIILLHVRAFEDVLYHSGLESAKRIAKTTGAAGMILWMDLPGNEKYATQLFDGNKWIDQIPWVTIGYEDGLYLRKLIESLPEGELPMVRLTVNGELKTEGTSQNLIAELSGTTDETIVITAHIDGYWNAILDNGTGVSILMEMARYYANIPKHERKRRIVFLITGDHELMGSGGSVVFQEMNPDIVKNSILALQIEHLGGPGVTNFFNTAHVTNADEPLSIFVSNSNKKLLSILVETANNFGLALQNLALKGTAGDVDGLTSIPSFGYISTGWVYHSTADDLKYYSPLELAIFTRAHLQIIDKVNELDLDEIKHENKEDVLPIYSSPGLNELLSSW